jgi:hypothetical protein
MKLLLSLTILLVGCNSSDQVDKPLDKTQVTQTFVDNKIRFVKIDNCEYIVTSFQPLVITHKGNCTNHK